MSFMMEINKRIVEELPYKTIFIGNKALSEEQTPKKALEKETH